MLKPGRKLTIDCPNIVYGAKVMCGLPRPPRGAAVQFDMWPFYGDPTHRNPLYGHRWGYALETLTDELVAAWFKTERMEVVRARHHFPGRDLRIEVSKD